MQRWMVMVAAVWVMPVSAAYACKGMDSEDYVLLHRLPKAAFSHPIVAKVRLLASSDDAVSYANVVVESALKGVKKGEKIRVVTSGSSCSFLEDRSDFSKAGLKHTLYFIAGEYKRNAAGELGFIGSWRAGKRVY